MRERSWKYILDGLLVAAPAIPTLELLCLIPVLKLEREFALLYFCTFFLGALLLEAVNKGFLRYRLLPAIPVAVLITSRDAVLFVNCLSAIVVYIIFDILIRLSVRKWILGAALIILLVFWIPREGIPGYVGGSLILLFAAVISECLKGEKRNRWVVLLSLTAVIAFVIPSSEEPMKWEGVRGMISRIGDWMDTSWKNITYFFEGIFGGANMAYSGYSEAGGLSGQLGDSSREELFIETQGRKQPVYLTGVTFAELGKNGFTERLPADEPVNAWFATFLSALCRGEVSKEEAACFTASEGGNITYAYIRTTDLLLPATTFRVPTDLKYGLSETAKKGFTYDFHFMNIDSASPYYRKLADSVVGKAPASYEEAESVALEIFGIHLSECMTKEEYGAAIAAYEKISGNPVYLDTSMVTERMQTLATQLTEGCASDMDKAMRIEQFLRQYPYDLSIDLRGRENYVDSFLFVTQSGYCVHYASAMVCLLRACGIPARYVQGLLYNPDKTEGVVTGGNAHAWAEAYISGLGWVRYEPTPSESSAEAYTWGLRVRPKTGEGEEEIKLPEESGELPEVPDIPEVVPTEETSEEDTTVKDVLITVGIYLLSIIGIMAVILAGYFLVRHIAYLRLSPKEKLMSDVNAICKKMDAKLPEGEKAESVFDYLLYVEDENCQSELKELFKGYYRVRFRGDDADPKLVLGMHGMIKRLK